MWQRRPNDAENVAWITGINYIFKCIKIENNYFLWPKQWFEMWVCYPFCCLNRPYYFTKSWFCFLGLLEQIFKLECSKNTLFFTYLTLLQLLSSQSVSNALFSSCLYEAPPSEKCNVLWLEQWNSVLWLVNCFKCVLKMSRPLL